MFFVKYYGLLRQNGSFSLFKLIILGLVAGLSGTALIIIINNIIVLDPQNKKFFPELFAAFMSVMGTHFFVQRVYQAALLKLSMNLIWEVRIKSLDNIRNADYQKFLSFGTDKVYNILTSDAGYVSRIGQMLASIIIAVITIVSCLVYLLWLTPVGFLISIVTMILVGMVHMLNERKMKRKIREAVVEEDAFFKYFNYVFSGLKELKLNRKISDDLYFNHIKLSGDKAKKLRYDVNVRFLNNTLTGQIFFFGIISLFLFILPYFNVSLLSNSFQYILVTLYIMGPAQIVAQFIPDFFNASVGLDRFRELEKLEESMENSGPGTAAFSAAPSRLVFSDVIFHYEKTYDEEGFSIGPLSFEMLKSEIVFISGGNGSGKSTFIRLLTGLYPHSSGSIMVDDIMIEQGSKQAYRSLFSSIYTDNYLFDKVFGLEGNYDREMNELLKELGLASKVNFVNGAFSTIDLSFGQRKRLSLAASLLENRPVYVFDELAANQDMEFKEYFYKSLLPALKAKGKIVIVVTHDEKYFNVADKHYKMEAGKIFPII